MVHSRSMLDSITIFTDGAAKGNPGRGGYGAVIALQDHVIELGGFKERTTNNEMELQAVVVALRAVADRHLPVALYTDSKYVVEGATSWVFGWMKNDWQTKAGSAVANLSLWQELVPLLQRTTITWHKVPGHVGIIGNERADTIASTFASTGTCPLYDGARAAYSYDVSNTAYDDTKKQDRSDARKRQAQKAYSYISLVDGVVATHRTWSECEQRVKGTKGARFKKSLNAADEASIIAVFKQ